MANGLFSQNAQVMGPEQAMANVGRGLTRAAEPALGMMGMQSQEQQVMNIMKGVNPTDINSVTDGFRKILEVSPAAAAEYRKQMLPFVTAQQEQLATESDLTKSRATLVNALKKESIDNKDEKEIYKNIRDLYKLEFCGGGAIFGGGCMLDPTNPNHKKYAKLPELEEFADMQSPEAGNIYRKWAGKLQKPTEDTTQKPKQKQKDATTTENVVKDDRGEIIEYGDSSIQARFGLSKAELKQYGKAIKAGLKKGTPDKVILDLLDQFRYEDAQTQADGA